MIDRILSRDVPPPKPSQKSANPSSCKAPVASNRAASAMSTAICTGRNSAVIHRVPAMIPPVSHQVKDNVVLIDCVTLWCTNFFFDLDADVEAALQAVKQEFDNFIRQDATFIFVTNEIGSGAVSENATQRRFTDLQGWMNQYIASKADQVYLMVSGIPVPIK